MGASASVFHGFRVEPAGVEAKKTNKPLGRLSVASSIRPVTVRCDGRGGGCPAGAPGPRGVERGTRRDCRRVPRRRRRHRRARFPLEHGPVPDGHAVPTGVGVRRRRRRRRGQEAVTGPHGRSASTCSPPNAIFTPCNTAKLIILYEEVLIPLPSADKCRGHPRPPPQPYERAWQILVATS